MKQFSSGNLEILGSRLLSKSHMADVKWANRWLKPSGSSPCHFSSFAASGYGIHVRRNPAHSELSFQLGGKEAISLLEVLMAAAQTEVSFQIWESLCFELGDLRLFNFREQQPLFPVFWLHFKKQTWIKYFSIVCVLFWIKLRQT